MDGGKKNHLKPGAGMKEKKKSALAIWSGREDDLYQEGIPR